MDGEMRAKHIVLLLVLLFACGLVVSSVWGAPIFTSYKGIVISLWDNAGSIFSTVIKWPACWGMIGLVLIYIVSKYYSSKPSKHTHTKSDLAPITTPAEKWQPWLHIPDIKENRKIIQLWCEGKSAEDIGQEVFRDKRTIHNIISDLRSEYPDAKIPKDTERKKMMKFWLSQ